MYMYVYCVILWYIIHLGHKRKYDIACIRIWVMVYLESAFATLLNFNVPDMAMRGKQLHTCIHIHVRATYMYKGRYILSIEGKKSLAFGGGLAINQINQLVCLEIWAYHVWVGDKYTHTYVGVHM